MDPSTIEELKSKLEDEFSDYYEIAGGKNYRYIHLEAVHNLVKKLLDRLDVEVDQEVLKIAALYHDIGRVEDIEDGRMDPFEGHEGHAQRGAEKVSEFVSDYVTEDQLEKIEKIIRSHHSEPETTEGQILQDADKLSKFGVNNLWRQFHYACEHGADFNESIDYFWNTAIKDYKELTRNMHFDHTKEVAEKRLKRQKEAFRQIEKEMNAEDV